MHDSEQNSGWGSGFLGIILLLLFAGFIYAILKPNYIGLRRSGPAWERHLCIDNLRQIDSAINEWAVVKGITNGTVIIEDEIKPYIKLDAKGNLPKCPSDGKYALGKVGDFPQVTCSLSTANPPHVLP